MDTSKNMEAMKDAARRERTHTQHSAYKHHTPRPQITDLTITYESWGETPAEQPPATEEYPEPGERNFRVIPGEGDKNAPYPY